jgi:Zn finger protein HypA/HybF involved in hydrogenase expression
MKCEDCEVDVIDVQTKMQFRALPAEQKWVEFQVLASVCPKCGKMELNVAVPAQFARWVAD